MVTPDSKEMNAIKGIDDALRHNAPIKIIKPNQLKEHLQVNTDTSYHDSNEIWEEMIDLPQAKAYGPSVTEDMIPVPLRPWAIDNAKRLNVPLECANVPAIAGLAGLCGSRLTVRPKQFDFDWLVALSVLWFALIATSGKKKTTTINYALKPFNEIISELWQAYNQRNEETEQDRQNIALEISRIEKQLSSPSKKIEKSKEELRQALVEEKLRLKELTPTIVRLKTNDVTREKAADLLAKGSPGITICADELVGWIKDLERPGQEGSRAFFLKGWNGTEDETVDRIGRGTTYVPNLFTLVVGGIQPEILNPYIEKCFQNGEGADGLIQRFQMMIMPDYSECDGYVDQNPDIEAYENVKKIFRKIFNMKIIADDEFTPSKVNFDAISPTEKFPTDDEECGFRKNKPFLCFDAEGQSVFDQFILALEKRLNNHTLPSAIESFVSKQRSTMPALAMAFHLINLAAGNKISQMIGKIEAEMAWDWCQFFEEHAFAVFEQSKNLAISAAHALKNRILSGQIKNGASVRDIRRKKWAKLSDGQVVNSGLAVLEEHNIIKLQTHNPQANQPSVTIKINPKFAKTRDVQ